MIQVEGLTKRYGPNRAVQGLTFQVGRGEVVGLLGPNGAGKTSTMRMLTTYLAPSAGHARLDGKDVVDEPGAVRARVGYLPENVPLYPEMRVREYLTYRSRLKDVPAHARRAAVDGSIRRCGLAEVEDRIVGQLSRGYRQRVGLADALVHDPPILILDEPTAGLDPIQVREVRALIRDLGRQHTVLVSTHILPEVEAVCTRVIALANGRLAMDEPLRRDEHKSTLTVEARGPADALRRLIEVVPGVGSVVAGRREGEVSTFEVRLAGEADAREEIARRVVAAGWGLRALEARRSTLEERFIRAVQAAGPR